MGCQRSLRPFSLRRTRQWPVSRSMTRNASAPPRRQAVSVCRRRSSASRMTSLPLVRAAALISPSSSVVSARRWLGSLRGLATVRGAGGRSDQAVRDGSGVDRAGGGDHVFTGVPPVSAVASGYGGAGHVVAHGFDVGGGDLVQSEVAPAGDRCQILCPPKAFAWPATGSRRRGPPSACGNWSSSGLNRICSSWGHRAGPGSSSSSSPDSRRRDRAPQLDTAGAGRLDADERCHDVLIEGLVVDVDGAGLDPVGASTALSECPRRCAQFPDLHSARHEQCYRG